MGLMKLLEGEGGGGKNLLFFMMMINDNFRIFAHFMLCLLMEYLCIIPTRTTLYQYDKIIIKNEFYETVNSLYNSCSHISVLCAFCLSFCPLVSAGLCELYVWIGSESESTQSKWYRNRSLLCHSSSNTRFVL